MIYQHINCHGPIVGACEFFHRTDQMVDQRFGRQPLAASQMNRLRRPSEADVLGILLAVLDNEFRVLWIVLRLRRAKTAMLDRNATPITPPLFNAPKRPAGGSPAHSARRCTAARPRWRL